jgi:hypothetical protein
LRFWDGRAWTQHQPPQPPNKRPKWLVPAAIVGIVVVLAIMGSIGDDDKKTVTASTTTTSPAPLVADTATQPATPPAPMATVGQEVRDRKLAFTVASVDRSKIGVT